MLENKSNKPLYPYKNHQAWSRLKSEIHNNITARNPYREGEIYWFYFGNNIGVEQDGKHAKYHRPAIIVRGFSDALIWVIPLSRTKRTGKYYYTFDYFTPKGMRKHSKAVLSQLRSFDTGRICGNIVGSVQRQVLCEMQERTAALVCPTKSRSR